MIRMKMRVQNGSNSCVIFFCKILIGIRHPDRINDSGLTIRNDHIRKATLPNSEELVERTTVRKITNLHRFQMLTPCFHSTFQISDILDSCLFQNFHSLLGGNSFGTHDIDRLVFWQLSFYFFSSIFQLFKGNVHALYISSLDRLVIVIFVLSNIQKEDTFVCENLLS